MKKRTYIALLRGINVGGNNIIKMAALKGCFEKMGFSDVHTFMQSGNVICTATEERADLLCQKIEAALSKTFNYKACLVLMTDTDLKHIVKNAPLDFGTQPSLYRYDVLFLKPPLTATQALNAIPIKEGVDNVYAGKHVVYFSRLISKITQSRLNKIIGLSIYKDITIRNWNTTTKLLKLI